MSELPAPGSSAPGSSAPGSSAPGSSAPGSPAPGSPAPGSPAPGSPTPGSPARRRRSDAERSIAAILEAAAQVLGRDPQAGMEQIARAAGTSRQTVYAHFPSREALLAALTDRATERVSAAIGSAGLEQLDPREGLLRLLGISWQIFESEPFLLQLPPPAGTADERAQHQPVLEHLERLIRRGRREGVFDRALPTEWLLAAIVALGHAAGEEVRAGRLTARRARAVLERSLMRLLTGA